MSSVRLAQPKDVPLLPEIEQRASERFRGLVDDQLTRSCVPLAVLEEARHEGRLFVAVDSADRPLGFALVLLLDQAPHLEELDVHPEHHGRGFGSALIEAVCAWARASGYTSLTLSTFRDIPWNAPYYARRGFRILREDEIGPGLRTVLAREKEHGLDAVPRVLLRRQIDV